MIGLGGAVDDALLDDVSQRFGGLEDVRTPPRPATLLPAEAGPVVHVERRESDQAHIVLGAGGLPLEHPDRYVASILQTVLGGGMSSRLFTEVRERRGLAYYVFASHSAYTDAGSLVVRAGVDTARVGLAVETIAAELRRIAEEPVDADELGKAQRYVTGRLVLGLEEPRGHDHVRAAPAAARGPHGGARRGRRGHRGRHRRGRAAPGRRADPPRAHDAGRHRAARGGAAARGAGRRRVSAVRAWIPRAADRLPEMDADRLVARHRAHLRELLPSGHVDRRRAHPSRPRRGRDAAGPASPRSG